MQLKDVEYLTKSTTRRKLGKDEIFMAMSIDDQGYAEEEGDGTLTDRRNSLERAENLEQKQREKEL